MKNLFLPLAILSILLLACSSENSHDHEAHEHHEEEHGLEPLAYTIYTEKTELLVEFNPLIVGEESRFAAHFTVLGELFKALREGNINLTLEVNGKKMAVSVTEPEVPGIFFLALSPETSGSGKLTFDIKASNFTDQIIIDNVKVYPNEKAALAEQPKEDDGNDITFYKDQAWKIEFANVALIKQRFNDIIKTSGQIHSAPGDEMIVVAKAGGLVRFSSNKSIIGSEVNAGTNLFTISSGDLAEGNIDAAYKEAKANYEKAKVDFDRASELVKDKIVSEKDFQDAKLKYENAETAFNTLAKNYSANGLSVSSPTSGFVKNIFVTAGQFVEAGTPLATISKNKKLILQANVSQKYFNSLASITSANFKTTDSEKFISTSDLNGKVISYGKSATMNSPFIPITFEIDNIGNIIPGSVAEVYLKSFPISDALVIPTTSLLEEQGYFFVYVQTGGESFQKREVKLGASDGMNVQVLSGVAEGERVVTKGAYQIKLATASGSLPAHGHEH